MNWKIYDEVTAAEREDVIDALVSFKAPFFAGAKLPTENTSSHFKRPFLSSFLSGALHAFPHASFSSQYCRRHQQVLEDRKRSGITFHRAPDLRTHKILQITSGLWAAATLWQWWEIFRISFHCSSVSSKFARLVILTPIVLR